MVAVPADWPVTSPIESTVATVVSVELQVATLKRSGCVEPSE